MSDSCVMPAGVVQDDVVLFAVPKKGRIYEDVMKLLKGSGLGAKRPERLDVAMCTELPVKLVFLPAADIPSYVMEGNVDLGISGHDMVEETLVGTDSAVDPQLKVLAHLGLGRCSLCLQAPKVLKAKDPRAFLGKRIVTSFPNIARRYFDSLAEDSKGSKTVIKVVSGSVEAACGLGLADAVVDLVETGTTMHAAGLEVVGEPIFRSEALLFQQVPTAHNGLASGVKAEVIKTIEQRIRGYLTATRFVMVVFNCHADNLQECCQITPGKRSPTVTELKESGWHSVSALVRKEDSNSVLDKLTKAGAQDILSFELTNTRM
mmetsp:Transcript_106872/g.334313  ORF Transcript_106872/g.334313 Transcript_106872/m.334313 type:complete len:319 (-) Transcript_106872:109-1065(-)